MWLLLLQDEISFRLDVPLAGDSVDKETGGHDVMMTVPPNKVCNMTYNVLFTIFFIYKYYDLLIMYIHIR